MIDQIVDVAMKHRQILTSDGAGVDLVYQLLHLRRTTPVSQGLPTSDLRAAEVFGYRDVVQDGWRLVQDSVVAPVFEKDGLRLTVSRERVLAGGRLSLPAIRDRYTAGYCALQSQRTPPPRGIRLYLAPRVENLPLVARLLVAALQDLSDEYVVKALNSFAEFPRSDALTAYFPVHCLEGVVDRIKRSDISSNLDASTRPSVFAKDEAPGAAWMESVAHTSGGFERAVCVLQALRSSAPEPESLREALRTEFFRAGIDPERPYMYASERNND